MLSNNNKNECGTGNEMSSYIYGEASEAEQMVFEQHLLDCQLCTDEMAAVSEARYAVFEWRKEEFAPLPTPAIKIPYEPRVVAASADISEGLWQQVKGLFGPIFIPATGFALLLVLIGVAFFTLRQTNIGSVETASNIVPPKVEAKTEAVKAPETLPVEIKETVAVVKDEEPKIGKNSVDRPIRPQRAVNNVAPVSQAKYAVNGQAKKDVKISTEARQSVEVPRLNDYDEINDRTLRLSDLFESEGGASN